MAAARERPSGENTSRKIRFVEDRIRDRNCPVSASHRITSPLQLPKAANWPPGATAAMNVLVKGSGWRSPSVSRSVSHTLKVRLEMSMRWPRHSVTGLPVLTSTSRITRRPAWPGFGHPERTPGWPSLFLVVTVASHRPSGEAAAPMTSSECGSSPT